MSDPVRRSQIINELICDCLESASVIPCSGRGKVRVPLPDEAFMFSNYLLCSFPHYLDGKVQQEFDFCSLYDCSVSDSCECYQE